jgi:hypothetical protein
MSARRGAQSRALHVVDVFVYVVVLGLFVQFLPRVISESFAVSLVTAVLLKLVLEVVVMVKSRLVRRLRGPRDQLPRAGRVLSIAGLVATGAGSKFLVLWLTDTVLGDAVSLGGFWSVTLLVVTLIAARAAVRRALSADAIDIA